MKKAFAILFILICAGNVMAQNKCIIYTDSTKAKARIQELNRQIVPICRARGDKYTENYGQIVPNKTRSKFAVEIIPVYGFLFTATEKKNAIYLPKDW